MTPRTPLALLAVALGAAPSMLAAQTNGEYPAKPIRWIIPAGPGSADILARMLGNKAGEALGQSFVIEHRPGAGGNIGAAAVAQAPSDGYTILMGNLATHGVNRSLYKSLPFDPEKDFAPISLLASAPNVLIVHPSLPVRNVKAFVEHARRHPGTTYSSAGAGTSMHMAGAMFQSLTGARMSHVPYKGTGEAVLSVARGDVQAMFSNLPPAVGMIKDGRVRAIAVTTRARVAWLPDLPTIEEEGLPGYDVAVWFGAFAPAGTPAPVVQRLAREFRTAAADPTLAEKLQAQGYLLRTLDPEEFGGFVRGELARWSKVVRETGAAVE